MTKCMVFYVLFISLKNNSKGFNLNKVWKWTSSLQICIKSVLNIFNLKKKKQFYIHTKSTHIYKLSTMRLEYTNYRLIGQYTCKCVLKLFDEYLSLEVKR